MAEYFARLKFEAFEQADKDYGMLFHKESGPIKVGDIIVFQELDSNGLILNFLLSFRLNFLLSSFRKFCI